MCCEFFADLFERLLSACNIKNELQWPIRGNNNLGKIMDSIGCKELPSQSINQINELSSLLLEKETKLNSQEQLINSLRNEIEGLKRLPTEEMVFSLIHEINQPLTAIFLYSQACLLQIEGKHSNKSNNLSLLLNKIITQTKHATEIISRCMKNCTHNDI